MTERMKQFFEAAIRNEKALAVLKNLKELSRAEKREQITTLAAEVGVTLAEDDFKQIDGAELTDEELKQIAAGTKYNETNDENEKKYYDLMRKSHEKAIEANGRYLTDSV